MAKKPDGGKKQRKFGRNARRASTARRKISRPELFHKARRVLQSSGEKALKVWADYRAAPKVWDPKLRAYTGYGDKDPTIVRKARDRALALVRR